MIWKKQISRTSIYQNISDKMYLGIGVKVNVNTKYSLLQFRPSQLSENMSWIQRDRAKKSKPREGTVWCPSVTPQGLRWDSPRTGIGLISAGVLQAECREVCETRGCKKLPKFCSLPWRSLLFFISGFYRVYVGFPPISQRSGRLISQLYKRCFVFPFPALYFL